MGSAAASMSALIRGTAVVAALVLASSACAGTEPAAPAPRAPAASPGSKLPAPLPPSQGTTYYVSPAGDDASPGTRDEPWRTIQKALDTLEPGERALVRAGTYAQDLVVRRAGEPGAPITVAAYPGETVILHARSTSGDTYPLRISSGAAYVRVRGFVIENARGKSSANVYFEGTASHVTLVDNEIRYSQDQGIFAERTTHDLQILRNHIHDNGVHRAPGQHQSHGIYLEGEDHLVANNVVREHASGFGIQIYPANVRSLIVHNTIVGNALGGVVVGGADGVRDIAVRNNVIAFNGGGYGVAMDSDCPSRVEIERNVLYGNGAGAVDRDCGGSTRGNILEDPRFVALAKHDLRVVRGSPALDMARVEYSPRTDIRGRRRPGGEGYDAGAYERS